MSQMSNLVGMNILISIVYYIAMSILLYIITSRNSYVINVVIYGLLRIVPNFFLATGITWKLLLTEIIVSMLVIYMAQKTREKLYYDSIIWYMVTVILTQVIISAVVTKFFTLF